MKKNEKTILTVFFIIIILLVIAIILFPKNNDKENKLIIRNETKLEQKNIKIKDIKLNSDGKLTNISANIENIDKKTFGIVNIDIVFYDKDGKEITRAKGLVENIKNGETKGFASSITGDYTKLDNYQIKIENIK